MLRIRIIGLALVATFAFSAMVAASASALVWELNGAKLEASMETTSTGELELEDSKVPLVGATAVKCKGTDKGTVNIEGKDTITEIKATECKPVKGGCESEVTAAAVHLPWDTQLVTVENAKKEKEVRDEIKSSGAGTPGWAVTCKTALGKKTDTCEGESSVGIDNVTEGEHAGDVAALFEAVTHEKPATCTEGGAKSGFVTGTDFIKGAEGVKLTASEAKNIKD